MANRTNRTKVLTSSVESVYRQVDSEEGRYDSHVGYTLHCSVQVLGGHVDHFLLDTVMGEDETRDLHDRLYHLGSVNLRKWSFQNRDHNLSDCQREDEDLRMSWRERMEDGNH